MSNTPLTELPPIGTGVQVRDGSRGVVVGHDGKFAEVRIAGTQSVRKYLPRSLKRLA
jgi:hypothetical protein